MRNLHPLRTKQLFQMLCASLILTFLGFSNKAKAQVNLAPLATNVAASAVSSGTIVDFNDLDYGNCGTQDVWISTSTPPSSTPGTNWIEFEWSTTRTFNKITIHNGYTDRRYLTGALLQVYNYSTNSWDNSEQISGGLGVCAQDYEFDPVSAKRFRITSFEMTGNGQLSNPSFREIEIWEANLSNNNAGVVSLDEPNAFCAGTYDVKATVKNFGLNQITSLKIGWSINDTIQSVINLTSTLDTNNGAGSDIAQITLGSVSFPVGQVKWIKVWTYEPNGVTDTLTSNDTILVDLSPALNGVYTIGSSGADYTSFSDVANALNSYGICGPVEFHVAAGTYNEQVEFRQLSGSSSTNTVRFIGSGRTSTILSHAGTSTANFVTLLLDGADYFEFRDMTIEGTGSSAAVAVMFTNEADYNALRNVHVETNTTSSSTNVTCIAFSGSKTSPTAYGDNGDYNLIDSVDIRGGYYGIRLNGTSTSSGVIGNTITNTTIHNYYYYGIYSYYTKLTKVDNCDITTNRNTGNADGLYFIYLNNGIITNNTIKVGDYGLYLSSLNNASYYDKNLPTIVGNNKIISTGDYGVYIPSNGGDLHFVQNSVNTSSAYSVRMNGGSNVVMLNNHIRNYRTSANSYAFYASAGFDTLDYNNYQSLGSGSQFYLGGTAYTNFASYQADQTLFDFEQHSYNQDPNFISNSDLHIDQSVINLRGLFVGFYYDADGDERCEFAPTLGADESYYSTPSPTASIALSDTVYLSSPTTFYSAFQPIAGVLLDYTWYIDNVQESKVENFEKVFGATGTYEVKLRVRSCTGNDRDSLMVDVVNPTREPVSDFAASTLFLDVLQMSNLTDLSDYGPTQWEWTAEPSYDAIFSDAYIANPTVAFLQPGEYKICLETANGVGQGNKLCKDAYINVNDDQMLCSSSESTYPAGRLTDEGGANGNYTASSNCNYIIRPCAGTLTLRFTEWDLSDADDELRIYDGTDNSGTLLGKFDGNSNIPGGISGLVSNSGKMYLEWSTSPGGQSSGFVAYWTSTPELNAAKPVADFTTQDTIFIDQVARFMSTSQGDGLSYQWDFDPPFLQTGLDGGNDESDRYSWSTAGSYPVSLKVESCGGSDALTKTIQVFSPTSAPVVGFTASRTKVPVLTKITLKDSSFQGGTKYKWKVTPAVTANILGADNGPELDVSFVKSGKYSVQLWVSNSLGADSLLKVDYIDVFDYCAPVVGNISSDVAISRVKFGGIDNFSDVGVAKYTNYLNDFPAEIVSLRDSIELTIERQSLTDPLNRKVWVDWNNDGDFDDVGEEVASEASNSNASYTTKIVVPQSATLGYTTLRVGVSYDQDVNRPCGINPTGEFEDYPIQVIVDDQIPVISLQGQDTVWVEMGYSYTDAGAMATDNIDGDLSALILVNNTVDTSMVGTYTVKYNVTDTDGNAAAEVTRIVMVTPDITAPVITLNGISSVDVRVNDSYTDAGATAEDYFQVNLTSVMTQGDNVDLAVIGTYHVWYKVEDASGNSDSIAREVNVIDDVNPVLTLLGNSPLTVEVNTMFNDPGYTVSDNYYATVDVVVDSSMIQYNVVGTYPVWYTATDGSGNSVLVTRMVSVEDNTAPTLSLIGTDTVVVEVFGSYHEQGVQVQDNYCLSMGWVVDQQPDMTTLGEYTLSYTSEDCNGNTSVALTRVVQVVDRTAPQLSLLGFPANTVYRWEGYTDPGVSITDNYYSEASLQSNIVITSNFDPNWVGYYSMCYQVTDPSSNASNVVCRTINVLESITSTEGVNDNKYSLYPNPSNGHVSLNFGEVLSEKAQIKVYDMMGKLVFETSANAGVESMSLNLSLANGVYQVAVSSEGYSQVIRMQVID